MKLNWKGPQLIDKMDRCQRKAINMTMTEAVIYAKKNHPWSNDTGTLEGGHRITLPASQDYGGWFGRWGVADVKYGLYLETSKKLGPKYRWLIPAAEQIHPHLAANLKACMANG